MSLEEFKKSLEYEHPPKGITLSLAALWYEGKGDWDQSHTIAQDIPTNEGAWVHAYLHRKEGDQWNANYWYTRAGRSMPELSIGQEWDEMVAWMLGKR